MSNFGINVVDVYRLCAICVRRLTCCRSGYSRRLSKPGHPRQMATAVRSTCHRHVVEVGRIELPSRQTFAFTSREACASHTTIQFFSIGGVSGKTVPLRCTTCAMEGLLSKRVPRSSAGRESWPPVHVLEDAARILTTSSYAAGTPGTCLNALRLVKSCDARESGPSFRTVSCKAGFNCITT